MQNSSLNKNKFWIFIIIVSALANPAHEFGHYLGFILDGVKVTRVTFNIVTTLNEEVSLLGSSGGPLISLSLALFALFMLYKSKVHKEIWSGFSFIMCLTRLIPYIVVFLLNFFVKHKDLFAMQDEGFMASYLNLPLWSVFIIFLLVFILIIILIVLNLKKYQLNYIKILGYSFLCYSAIVFIEVGILENIIFN